MTLTDIDAAPVGRPKHWLSAVGTGQDQMATTYQAMPRTLYGCACGEVRWTNREIRAHIEEENAK